LLPRPAESTSNVLCRSGSEQQENDAAWHLEEGPFLTTNQSLVIPDNQNSLKAGGRGPTLLEDFILREKITHFDHERIPKRIVHARGSGAHKQVPKGRANYEPNSIATDRPRESPSHGLRTVPTPVDGPKLRLRAETFADHYSQPRLFFRSVTPQERKHIASAFAFELGHVAIEAIRRRMLGHLNIIDESLGSEVAAALGMTCQSETTQPARKPIDLPLSPALRLYGIRRYRSGRRTPRHQPHP
jgi:catalase